MNRIGIDIGSTTIKVAVVDPQGELLFSAYQRHQADVKGALLGVMDKASGVVSGSDLAINITGSVGMGVSEAYGLPFTQEVLCATKYVKERHAEARTIIDIGGEDAKIVFLKDAECTELRMNGNCAGGTGSFIDQMAVLLNRSIEQIDLLAQDSKHVYPIASRCGVFSKTDIQNLIAKNVSIEDIAASIFRAVAVQTITTLSKGNKIEPKILLCGGPLTFIKSLRKAFSEQLNISELEFITPKNGNVVPAYGAALSAREQFSFDDLRRTIENSKEQTFVNTSLTPLFDSEEHYARWREEKSANNITQAQITNRTEQLFVGIDSGSTTTKIVATGVDGEILFTFYSPNNGEPIASVKRGLEQLKALCRSRGATPVVSGSCSTGYGEELIKSAFGLGGSIVETIAHYLAAKRLNADCSFILDIGGQDMKAIFVENGALTRIEINEACSSGCGTFIEAFAGSLNIPLDEFVHRGAIAENPCDLGTRCTVFMNSKVKQALREGATLGDIAAGLSFSVIKNCLYKVLKLNNTAILGDKIVLQGGTMRNDAIVRAFEIETGSSVCRSNFPELMGAYGCALYAISDVGQSISLDELISHCNYQTSQIECKGCLNRCYVKKYTFANNLRYYSGNKCENVFNNYPTSHSKGDNVYLHKLDLLFNRQSRTGKGVLRLGIPRALNVYENYPFWHTLFDECKIEVVLSDPSDFLHYEHSVHNVMSDNICFPAKLVHSHIDNLTKKGVDRIFMPFVGYEKMESGSLNSYNCPIVSGYNEVIRSTEQTSIVIDSPAITFKDNRLLEKQCTEYLKGLGVQGKVIRKALVKANEQQKNFYDQLLSASLSGYMQAHEKGELTILLAARPYHSDPLIQHKISDIIASMGVNVISEDIVRDDDLVELGEQSDLVKQWSYINRILRAAEFVAQYPSDIHFVQITSFGCGPDAFLVDEVQSILRRSGKSLTLLKVDDINNVGSLKLRVRSLIESLALNNSYSKPNALRVTTKSFERTDSSRTIILPYFTDYISPLISSIFALSGYRAITLPKSDASSVEFGLRYANNEVCYPATLVVGDILKYLHSCNNLDEIAVGITQTGGQCRASNYISLIKKGLVEAGFSDVPVVGVTFGESMQNSQPGFSLNRLKILPIAIATILFGDTLSKFYHSAVVREHHQGDAERLKQRYLRLARVYIKHNSSSGLYNLIAKAAKEFDSIVDKSIIVPKVGVVGEIYLKFHSFANKDIVEWFIDNRLEVVPPILLDFFMQSFVNRKVQIHSKLAKSSTPLWVDRILFDMVSRKIRLANKMASAYSLYIPFADIFDHSKNGEQIVSLVNQFGEGWLLPAEIVSFAQTGVNNVVCLQPFGCIANHIVSRGVEKKMKSLYPSLNLLSLDFDSGVSDTNITNRLLLFKSIIK